VIGITATVPVDDYSNEKAALKHLAETVTGIKANVPPVASPPAPTAAPIAPEPTPALIATKPAAAPITAQPTTPNAPAEGQSSGVSALPVTASSPNAAVGTVPTSAEIAANKLREINKLYKEGILNQREYDAKKQEILKGM